MIHKLLYLQYKIRYIVEYLLRQKKHFKLSIQNKLKFKSKYNAYISHLTDVNLNWLLGSVGESNAKQLLLSML